MENIRTYLKQIEELLDQIETMTHNQTTILLHQLDNEEEEALSMIEEIITYKDDVIQELTQVEGLFQENYQKNKEVLLQSPSMKEIKERVAAILETKERIEKQEQSNLRLLINKTRTKVEKIEIKPTAQCAINAYKKNQSLT